MNFQDRLSSNTIITIFNSTLICYNLVTAQATRMLQFEALCVNFEFIYQFIVMLLYSRIFENDAIASVSADLKVIFMLFYIMQ